MKVIFALPPFLDNPLFPKKNTLPPLGIAYLSSVLKEAGYESKAIDMSSYSWKEATKTIKSESPDVVGISCFTDMRGGAFQMSKIVKKINPDIKVIMGGPHSTFLYEQILLNFPVDSIVIGEGEETIIDLIKCFESNSELKNVRGIAFKNYNKIFLTERREFIKDLDSIPFPDYSSFDFNNYNKIPYGFDKILKYKKSNIGNIITSRGCPYSCQFCSTSNFWGHSWRERSAKNVVDEIELLTERGIKFFSFADDNFTVNKNRTIEICKELIARKIDIEWFCEARVNNVNKETLEWMVKAGCKLIVFGVESGSPLILKTINKNITPQQATEAFRLAKEVDLPAGIFLMIGNPNESAKTIEETIKWLDTVSFDVSMTALTRVYPGTPLYELAKQNGMVDDSYWLTDKIAPYYTAEKSLNELRLLQFKITSTIAKKKGIKSYTSFLFSRLGRGIPFGYDLLREEIKKKLKT